MDILRVIKTVTPAVLVLIAGLFGLNFIYNNYMDSAAGTVITLEPAAGEEAPVSVEDTAAPAVEETVEEVVEETVETTTEEVTEETTEEVTEKVTEEKPAE
jgi:hypothetical protein